ncbi:MAG: PAS domain S-box protein, partial [Planctomycetota bacterium]
MQTRLQEKSKKLEEKIRVLELDKISLIKKLQRINAELDNKVEIRTEELERSNRKLKNEIAERKRSEESLRESDHKFRELFNNANDAIYLWEVKADDTIGRCLEVNKVACKMLGYSREELLTFTPKDIDTQDAARGIPRVTRKLLEEKHITFEMIHKARDGCEIPVEINAHIFDLSGRRVVLSVTRDISERKKADEALKQQNLYLSALHETTLGLMSRLDLRDSLKAIINRAAALAQTQDGFIFLYDSQANELVLRVGVGVYNKREGLVLKPGEGLAGKVWQTGEFLIVDDYSAWPGRTPDSIFDNLHSVIGIPLRSENQVIGVIGLGFFDTYNRFGDDAVTALGQFAELASIALYNAQIYSKLAKELNVREQAERALKESHETFLTVLDSIDATIYVADMDTYEIIFMNKHMQDSFGG